MASLFPWRLDYYDIISLQQKIGGETEWEDKIPEFGDESDNIGRDTAVNEDTI